MNASYLETAQNFYRAAAMEPQAGLCCTTSPVWQLPGLDMPPDGPCVFTGKCAIYHGNDPHFDDGKGHMLTLNQPLAVCDKTAAALTGLGREDIYITGSTWHYDGGGCC